MYDINWINLLAVLPLLLLKWAVFGALIALIIVIYLVVFWGIEEEDIEPYNLRKMFGKNKDKFYKKMRTIKLLKRVIISHLLAIGIYWVGWSLYYNFFSSACNTELKVFIERK